MGGPKLTRQVGGGHNLPKPTRTQVTILANDGILNLTN